MRRPSPKQAIPTKVMAAWNNSAGIMPGMDEYPLTCVATATTTYVIQMTPVARKRPPNTFNNVAISFLLLYLTAFRNIQRATTARLP